MNWLKRLVAGKELDALEDLRFRVEGAIEVLERNQDRRPSLETISKWLRCVLIQDQASTVIWQEHFEAKRAPIDINRIDSSSHPFK